MKLLRKAAVAHLIVAVVMAVWLAPAGAHTAFESSDPADGSVVDSVVDVVTIVFAGESEPAGDGFQVLAPDGELRQPADASTVDGLTWVLRFDPPLAGGVVGMRWMVKAPDAHPIDGSFSFTTPDLPPAAEQSDETTDAVPLDTGGEESSTTDLEEFLDTGSDSGRSPQRVAAAGRFVAVAGTMIGIGGLAFAATAMRGRRRDVRHVLFRVRRAGLVVVVGTLIEFVGQVAIEGAGSWSALLSASAIGAVIGSAFGIAAALRLAGGLALASGARIRTIDATEVPDPVAALRELVGPGLAAGAGDRSGAQASVGRHDRVPTDPIVKAGDHAWHLGTDSAGAALGVLAILSAHLFDGHTVTKGNRLFTGVVDLIHVAGGAVWAGGVLMLASVLWRRHREGRDLQAQQLAIRFSVVATGALVLVGLAGVILTIIVLDSPSELWATEWGRILIAKTAFVGVAAAAGGYNHKILIPLMDTAPNDAELSRQFRNVVTAEAAALAAVVTLTAFLMGAAS